MLGKMLEVSNGTFAITKADHFMANGDWVAITIEFSAEANGLKLSQPGVDLMPSMAARLSKLVSSPRTRKKKTGYGASELCIALRRTGSGEDVADGREAQRLC